MSEELDRLKVDCATALANPQFTNWGAICNYINALEAALKERGAGEVLAQMYVPICEGREPRWGALEQNKRALEVSMRNLGLDMKEGWEAIPVSIIRRKIEGK